MYYDDDGLGGGGGDNNSGQDQFIFSGGLFSDNYDNGYNTLIGFLLLVNADSKKKPSRRQSSSDYNYSDDEDSGLCTIMLKVLCGTYCWHIAW